MLTGAAGLVRLGLLAAGVTQLVLGHLIGLAPALGFALPVAAMAGFNVMGHWSLERDISELLQEVNAVLGSAAPLDMAHALLQEGRLADAEQVMVKEVQAAKQRHGRGSPEWASAQCDLDNILLSGNQANRAVECFRSACSGPVPNGSDARKDWLTYQLNLGFGLTMTGRLKEGETELRRNLRERLAFYGRQHAGYAFGLEALAGVLLERGNIDRSGRGRERAPFPWPGASA